MSQNRTVRNTLAAGLTALAVSPVLPASAAETAPRHAAAVKANADCAPRVTKEITDLWNKARKGKGIAAYEDTKLTFAKLLYHNGDTEFTGTGINQKLFDATHARTADEAAREYLAIGFNPSNAANSRVVYEALGNMRYAVHNTTFFRTANRTMPYEKAEEATITELCRSTKLCGSYRDFARRFAASAISTIPLYVKEFKEAVTKTAFAAGESDTNDLYKKIGGAMYDAGIDQSPVNVRNLTGYTPNQINSIIQSGPHRPNTEREKLNNWVDRAPQPSGKCR